MALKRELHPVPEYISKALESQNLTEKYNARPAYQRNDYIGWITRAKRQETVDKRLAQMLEELEGGGLYMGMRYNTDKPGR